MIAVVFGGTPAALEALEWTAADPKLETALNLEAFEFWAREMVTSDPDPDLTHAKAMAAMFGGEIVGADQPPDLGNLIY